MRSVWGIAALLVATSPAVADSPPQLDEALAKAGQENKPLVIEFHAEWCKPCKYFEANVLTRADVRAALGHVVFVRYDLDESPGSEIAGRLDVQSVPTLVVLDSTGRVTTRHSGLMDGPEFLRMLASAGGVTQSTFELEAAVATAPDDLNARQRLAAHYRAIGRPQDAIEQLTYVAEHAGGRRELAANAAAERDAIATAETRIADAMAAADKFIESYPDSSLSSARLAELALSRRASRERLEELSQAHVDAVALDDWPNAIRAALIAGADSIVHRSIQQRLARDPKQPAVLLVRAEELLVRRDPARANESVRDACRQPGAELWCYTLQQTLDTHRPVPSRLARLRDAATLYLDTLADPKPHESYDTGIDRLADLDEHFGNLVAIALDEARLECGYLATANSVAIVGLELAQVGGRMRLLRVFTRDGHDLETCLRRVLERVPMPRVRPPTDERLGAFVLFNKPRPWEPPYAMPPKFGVMPELFVRRGAVETTGFRGDFRVSPRRQWPWLVGATLEFAFGDTRDPAYAARVISGMERRVGTLAHASATIGVGVSDFGTHAPVALEIPLEQRIRVQVGRARIHLWASAAYVFFDEERMATSIGSFHELGLGAGVSFPILDRRFFLGCAYEARAVGDSAMFVLGAPVGELY